MSRTQRLAATMGLGVLAAVLAWLLSVQVTRCFSGINRPPRSMAESFATGCLSPTIDLQAPVVAAAIVIAVVLWRPRPDFDRVTSRFGALLGAVLGVATYAVLRAAQLTVPTSTGEIVTVHVPGDPLAVTATAIAGGAIGWALGTRIRAAPSRSTG